MSDINLHNYEAFFLDYIEGNLVAEKVAELLLFLEKNPTLKKELEEFEMLELSPDKSTFPNKNQLLQNINSDNVEEYIIADIEGELDIEDKKDLYKHLESHKEDKVLFNRYEKTRLIAPQIIFPNKYKLKKRSSVIVLYPLLAVAASLLVIFILNNGNSYQRNYSPHTLSTVIEVNDAENENIENEKVLVQQDEIIDDTTEEPIHVAPNHYKKKKKVEHFIPENDNLNIAENKDSVIVPEPEEFIIPIDVPIDDNIAAIDSVDNGNLNTENLELATNNTDMTMKEWANKSVRNKILKQETENTDKIKKEEVFTALANGLDKITKKDLAYNHSSDEDNNSFSVSFGRFEFSRSKRKK